MLLQRLESSRDQGSGYTKMVLILSDVVNVKIKDILRYHLITHLKVYRQLVSIFKNMLEHNKSNNESHFRIDEWSALALQSPSSLSWSNVSIIT